MTGPATRTAAIADRPNGDGMLRRLLPAVRAKAPDTVVVASGFSCRHQIRHFTGVETVSPAVLLRSLLAGLPGKLFRSPGSTAADNLDMFAQNRACRHKWHIEP
jgi:hypothetical protein